MSRLLMPLVQKVRQELFRRYREALDSIRDLDGTPDVCGILPCLSAGTRWWSETLTMNNLLANHCKRNRWLLLDNWVPFFSKDHLYARDGIHLSPRGGMGVLVWRVESEMSDRIFLRCQKGVK